MICFDGMPLAGPPAEGRGAGGRRRVLAFLLIMAVASLGNQAAGCLIGSALRAWFGLAIESWMLSLILHLAVTLVGTAIASQCTRGAHHSSARRQMLLTLLAAAGISLILAWLSRLVGQASTFSWPLALVYLLWASASRVSTG